MSRYVKKFKVKEENNKLMSFCIDNEKLLTKIKIDQIEEIEKNLNALPVYDGRYIKTKIRTFGDKVYTNFRGINLPKSNIKCESYIVISIDSLLVYEEKYYLQAYHLPVYKTIELIKL